MSDEVSPTEQNTEKPSRVPFWKRRRTRILLNFLLSLTLAWLAAAYIFLPIAWRHYEHNPGLQDAPKTTVTAQGIPGDPLNVGLIGEEREVVAAMLGVGWHPADPVTLRSSIEIADSVLLDRPYNDAPVSPLFVFGRKQDLAFEKPIGESARHRHHVRFWRSDKFGQHGLPLWVGAVTLDRSVGLSHLTGQITHHISPDVDTERDALIGGLREGGRLLKIYQVTGVGATLNGRNGGGDRYDTDGELTVGVLSDGANPGILPTRLANPPAVRLKEQLWSVFRPLMRSLPGQ